MKYLILILLFITSIYASNAKQEITHSHSWINAWRFDGGYIAAKKDGSLWQFGALPNKRYNILNKRAKRYILKGHKVLPNKYWVDISVVRNRVYAIASDGTMWAWGREIFSDQANSYEPRKFGYINNWKTVETVGSNEGGECVNYTMAFTKDGTLYGWGGRSSEVIFWPQGSKVEYDIPVFLGRDWSKAAMGCYKAYALKKDGKIYSWSNGNSNPRRVVSSQYRKALKYFKRQRYKIGLFKTRLGDGGYNSRYIGVHKDGTLWLKSVYVNYTGALLKKPAIYLYPPKEQKIDVKLKINGEITKSIPAYKNGWSVVANSDGIIDNKYDYLFYENTLNSVKLPNYGWIKRGKDIESFFDSTLPKLGLNKKESQQFKEYWVKRFKSNSLYEIKLFSKEFLAKNLTLNSHP